MTRDDYIKLHRDTVAAIDLVDEHGLENCFLETTDCISADHWDRCDWMPTFYARYYRARLKPQPKLVPWESLDEVPLTHWFRLKGTSCFRSIEETDSGGNVRPIRLFANWITLADLHRDYEHADPRNDYRNLVWSPCGREVEQ